MEYLSSFYVTYRVYYGVEKNASAIGNTKWDGIVFEVGDKTVNPMFVELSGGIDKLQLYREKRN